MKHIVPLFILWMGAWSAPVAGQEPEPEPELSDFNTAVEAYSAGDYAKAAALFQKAYVKNPDPLLLYNAAKAQAKASPQNIEGLKTAQALLSRALSQKENELGPKDRLRAEAFEAELTAQVTAAQAERERKAQFEEQLRQAELRKIQGESSPSSGFGPIGWTGVGLGTLGAVVTVGAVVLASDVSSEQERLSSQKRQTKAQFEADVAQGQSDQKTAQILLFSGLGALAVGAGLVTWELVRDKESAEGSSLRVGPSGVTWEMTW